MAEQTAARRAGLVQELVARERWSRDELVAHQRHALRRLVAHAASASPYYRDVLGENAAEEGVELEDLPTLPKGTLMAEWDRIVTDPRLRLRDVERHLAAETEDLHLSTYRVFVTGGSTGRRGVFAYGADEFELAVAAAMRVLASVGGRPGMRVAGINSPNPFHLTKQLFAAMRPDAAAPAPLAVTSPTDELVAELNERRPEVLATYPTVLRLLAEAQLDGRLRIEPRVAATSSEALTAETRERAREAWGIEPRNIYACTEACALASECTANVGLHVWEDLALLEVVDERGRAVPPGVPGDKVLVTNLWNLTQPLIRYELEDSVVLADGPNPTARPFARIAQIDGRSADILRLPASGGGEVAVHPIHLRMPFGLFPEVVQYQLGRTEDGIRVRLLLAPEAPLDTPDRVRTALVEALRNAGAVPGRVTVEPVDAIDRVGAAAKLTLVESGPALPEVTLIR